MTEAPKYDDGLAGPLDADLESASDVCETSVQQDKVWLLHRLREDGPRPRTVGAYRLAGSVSADSVRAALSEAVAGLEILRTTLERAPGLRFPHQVIHGSGVPVWHDETAAEAGEAVERLWAWAEGAAAPAGSALLAGFASCDSGDSVLLLSAPAYAADLASLHVLAALAVGSHTVTDEDLQYADYAGWQAEQLDRRPTPGSRPAANATAGPIALPWRRPTAPDAPPLFAQAPLAIDATTAARVAAVAAAHHADPEDVLLACWLILAARLSGSKTVAVDRIVAGRDSDEVRDAVGAYETASAISCEVSADMRFSALLAQVADLRTQASVQGSAILGELRTALDRDEIPAAGSGLAFRYRRADHASGTGAPTWTPLRESGSAHPCEVLLACTVSGTEWIGAVHYDTARYPAATMDSLAHQLVCLLADAVEHPGEPIAALRSTDGAEQQRALAFITARSRELPAPDPGESTVHGLFEARAAADPAALAVGYEDVELSFGELDAQSNRLARRLRTLGVARDVPVALFADRSAEAMVAVLAILKAGGAYLPINADTPASRIAFMLDDARAAVILTHSAMRDRLPDTALPVLCLDTDTDPRSDSDVAPAGAVAGPDDLAYIIYTSGTTGRPKGVAVTHRNAVYLWSALRTDVYECIEADGPLRVAINGPLSFDTSVKQLIQLCSGHSVHPIPSKLRLEPAQLVAYLSEHRIDVVDCTPAQFTQWLDIGGLDLAGGLRAVLLGGEPVSAALWSRLANAPLAAFNLYGPTECTVDATTARITGPTPHVGRPLPGTAVYVLTVDGTGGTGSTPAPLGTIGELCVAGPGVSRGYLGDTGPDGLTARRFVIDPFAAGRPGAGRMYHTGDLGRLREDGTIDVLGRADRQVKIRGFRVEPGEAEEALLRCPGVRQAVVGPHRRERGDTVLAAYVVLDGSSGAGGGDTGVVEALRERLSAELPDYLVPASFTVLDALPLSANGKVDYRALPEPDDTESAGYIAPRTSLEAALCEVWAEVLDVEKVGIRDNFFALGGDSIGCIQAVARARRREIRLTALQIIRHQTVAELAAAIEADRPAQADQGQVAGDVPLTPIQSRFFERGLSEPQHWNQSVVLGLTRDVPTPVLRSALAALVAHHDALRSRFATAESGGARQWVAAEQNPDDLLIEHTLPGTTAESDDAGPDTRIDALADGVQRSLDLESGPVIRALLVRTGDHRTDRLLIAAHHLVVDGVSWRVLLEDLETAVAQLLADLPVRLPAKTTSYQSWARALRDRARAESVLAQREYWRTRQQRAGEELPQDGSGGPNIVGTSREFVVEFDRAQTDALSRWAPSGGRSGVADVLLAALTAAVGRWTGAEEISVELEGHGRAEQLGPADLSRTVGWFTAVYPVRLAVVPEAAGPAGALAGQVAAVRAALGEVPDGGVGYGLLRYGAPPEHRLAPAPADLGFNYLGRFDGAEAADHLFVQLPDAAGQGTSEHAPRAHVIDLDASILGGQLRIYWSFSPALHRDETVRALADDVRDRLLALIAEPTGTTDDAAARYPLNPLSPAATALVLATEPVTDILPLTPSQRTMLDRRLAAPHFGQYVYQWVVRLDTELDPAAFEAAVTETVALHEALRSTLYLAGGEEPAQLVRESVATPMRWLDWSELSEREQAEREQALLTAAKAGGVDPSKPPLADIAVARLAPGRSVLMATFGLLVIDMASFGRFLDEVLARHAAALGGSDAASSGDPADRVAVRPVREQRAWLAGQDWSADAGLWRNLLAGAELPTPALELTDLPADRPRAYRELSCWLDEAATEGFRALARACRVAPSVVLHLAWSLALYEHTGERDAVFGALVSELPVDLDDGAPGIGRHTTTLPIRTTVPEHGSIADWARDHSERLFAALQRPFVGEACIARWHGCQDPAAALYHTLVNWEAAPMRDVVGDAHWAAVTEIDTIQAPDTPVKLAATAHGPKLRMSLAYLPETVSADTARELFDLVSAQIARLAADPGGEPSVHWSKGA